MTQPEYKGQRKDLMNNYIYSYSSKSEIDRRILMAAKNPYGIVPDMVSELIGCSREWVRRRMLDLARQDKLTVMKYGKQLIMYRLPSHFRSVGGRACMFNIAAQLTSNTSEYNSQEAING